MQIQLFYDDEKKELARLAEGFKVRSRGDMFANVISVLDGWLPVLRCPAVVKCVPTKKDEEMWWCQKGHHDCCKVFAPVGVHRCICLFYLSRPRLPARPHQDGNIWSP